MNILTPCATGLHVLDFSVMHDRIGVHWGLFGLWWIFWCARLGGTQPLLLDVVSPGLHCPHLQLMSPGLRRLIFSLTTGSGRLRIQLGMADMAPPVWSRVYSPVVRMRHVSHGSAVRMQYGSMVCRWGLWKLWNPGWSVSQQWPRLTLLTWGIW